MSSVDDLSPKACLDQVNTFEFVAVELGVEVAVQVRVKLFEGGTSITEI